MKTSLGQKWKMQRLQPPCDREQDEVNIENGLAENAKYTIRWKSVTCITAAILEFKCNLVEQYFLLSGFHCVTQALFSSKGTHLTTLAPLLYVISALTSVKIREKKKR